MILLFIGVGGHGLPVENEDQAFEVFDACTHDKRYYLEYSGEEEMLHRPPPNHRTPATNHPIHKT